MLWTRSGPQEDSRLTEFARRHRDGSWGPTELAGDIGNATAALNEAGDAALLWSVTRDAGDRLEFGLAGVVMPADGPRRTFSLTFVTVRSMASGSSSTLPATRPSSGPTAITSGTPTLHAGVTSARRARSRRR